MISFSLVFAETYQWEGHRGIYYLMKKGEARRLLRDRCFDRSSSQAPPSFRHEIYRGTRSNRDWITQSDITHYEFKVHTLFYPKFSPFMLSRHVDLGPAINTILLHQCRIIHLSIRIFSSHIGKETQKASITVLISCAHCGSVGWVFCFVGKELFCCFVYFIGRLSDSVLMHAAPDDSIIFSVHAPSGLIDWLWSDFMLKLLQSTYQRSM